MLVHNRHTSNVNSYVDQVVRVSRFAQAQGSLARSTTLREYLHQVSLAYDRTVVDLAKDPSACNHGKYSDNLQKGTLVHIGYCSNAKLLHKYPIS